MALINHDGLARLSSNMEHMELGETIVRTKIELFSARRPERQMSDKLDMNLQSSPSWLAWSPIGPLAKPQTRMMLLQLIQTMNYAFPESDYSTLTPEHFNFCPDFQPVAQVINSNLFGEERLGFYNDFWRTLRDCVDFDNIDIYTFNPEVDADYSSLGQFHYFFYDRCQKRILLLSSVAKSKYPGFNSDSEEEEEEEFEEDSLSMSCASLESSQCDDEMAGGYDLSDESITSDEDITE